MNHSLIGLKVASPALVSVFGAHVVWGTVGEWVSGVGTVGAVVVSLWLIHRAEREKLEILPFLNPSGSSRNLEIEIENLGLRPVRIKAIAIVATKWGSLPGRIPYAFKHLPFRVEPGEIRGAQFTPETLADGFKAIGQRIPRVESAKLWVEVRTMRGKVIRVPCPEIRGLPVSVYDAVTDTFDKHSD
jgi:hypothetical protein